MEASLQVPEGATLYENTSLTILQSFAYALCPIKYGYDVSCTYDCSSMLDSILQHSTCRVQSTFLCVFGIELLGTKYDAKTSKLSFEATLQN